MSVVCFNLGNVVASIHNKLYSQYLEPDKWKEYHQMTTKLRLNLKIRVNNILYADRS